MASFDKINQSNFDAALFALTLDTGSRTPLHAQLADALRDLILTGQDVSGVRLPSGRSLAQELSVSRMTVTTAYDQLFGEGVLVARRGSGTYVAEHLPHRSALAKPKPRMRKKPQPFGAFQPGVPDATLFPHAQWARHLNRAWRSPGADLLAQPDAFGWYPLRQAICAHLSVWRSLTCDPEQVVITSGASEAIELLCRSVLGAGQHVAIEDPGWHVLRAILNQTGVQQVPIRIDTDGMNAAHLPDQIAGVFITPSRHYPTGSVLPLSRRLALLDWAAQQGGLVIEDDYDSEFRYRGQPLPSLSGLDQLQHTIYLGSYSKLLSAALRIGYLVLPEHLVATMRDQLRVAGSKASLVPQPALADFMESGGFASHLRRMRRIYAKRQSTLVKALEDAPGLTVSPDPSGMHLCCPLTPEMSARSSDRIIAQQAALAGVSVRALSAHSVLPDPPQGLLLGYAGFDEMTINGASQSLTTILRQQMLG